MLRWYDENKRPLPWRETRDPYAIWVSEIMAQQTRVETVSRYWPRFLERFPTVADLAGAEEDEVLSLWSGLGYYRRARLLHKGAKEVQAQYGGEVPADAAQRLALPGIGRYTAGAIGSISFEQPEAVVDGNVARVFSRLFLIETPLGASVTEKRLWQEAEALVLGERPGDWNQSIMELGALICTPKSPKCGECPVQNLCAAKGDGSVDRLPVPKAKKPPKQVFLSVVVAHPKGQPDQVFLQKDNGARFGGKNLFGGLWGLPTMEVEAFDPPQQDLLSTSALPKREDAQAVLRAAGLSGRLEKDCRARIKHVLSHRRLEIAVWRATGVTPKAPLPEGQAFVDAEGQAKLGIATLTKKVLAAIG